MSAKTLTSLAAIALITACYLMAKTVQDSDINILMAIGSGLMATITVHLILAAVRIEVRERAGTRK